MRLTLVSDGPTDQALLPILRWLVKQHSTTPFEQNWADARWLRVRSSGLAERIVAALDLMEDFAPLRLLPSFRAAEDSLRGALARLGRLRGARPA